MKAGKPEGKLRSLNESLSELRPDLELLQPLQHPRLVRFRIIPEEIGSFYVRRTEDVRSVEQRHDAQTDGPDILRGRPRAVVVGRGGGVVAVGVEDGNANHSVLVDVWVEHLSDEAEGGG